MLELYREYAVNLIDLHPSMMSNQMNQVMKILTIISTIVIPLSFITGLCGMNCINLPKLQWEQKDCAVWVVIVVLIAGMMYYFKRKRG